MNYDFNSTHHENMVSSMSGKAIIFSGKNDEAAFCDKCVKDFDGAGGCECVGNDGMIKLSACDQLSSISDLSCVFICGQKVKEYCEPKLGKYIYIIWYDNIGVYKCISMINISISISFL